MKRVTVVLIAIVAWSIFAIVAAGAFVYSGRYDIGADAHHTRPVVHVDADAARALDREHAKDIVVPDLDDAQLILEGAGHYAAMCTGCHLAPGMADSEIRPGLYPQAAELSQVRASTRARRSG